MDPQAYNVRQPSGPVPVTASRPKTQLIVGIDFVGTGHNQGIDLNADMCREPHSLALHLR